MDPVPYLADDRVSPADLARSPILQYLFTIDGR
jgi:glutathione S-transferase